MNETIGARGGHNDRKRSLIIRKQQKLRLIAEREEKEIKEEYRKGYMIGDKVIRHSMVIVAN